MRFHLVVTDAHQQVMAIDLEAGDEAVARDLAARQGYEVLEVSRQAADLTQLAAWASRRRRFSVLLFSQELHALLEAGLTLVESLRALSDKAADSETRYVLGRLMQALEEGESFSRALETLPAQFPALYVATARSSERTGDLREALARYIEYQEAIDRVRKKVISASIYPAILVGVGAAVFLFLLLYVIPRFAGIYEDIHTELPFFSEALLTLGRLVQAGGVPLAAGGLILLAGGAALLGSGAMRARMSAWAWSVPMIGERLKRYQLARLYRTLGMLLLAGVPVTRALSMVDGLVAAHLREDLMRLRQAIEAGRTMSDACREAGFAPGVIHRMLVVGERSGDMGTILQKLARFLDEDTAREIDAFLKVFEPALMAVLGLAVGGVVVLLYMPVFELAGSVR